MEEQSAEQALTILLPRVLDPSISFSIHSYQGKHDLLRRLPARLRGYARWIDTARTRIVVLVDEDRADGLRLKATLERAAEQAGLLTRSRVGSEGAFAVLNRIAVEELEAWFIGDPAAVRSAYPGVSPNFERRARFRLPDQVPGGTWRALEKLLQEAGHHRGGLRKIAAARDIASRMDPSVNRSPSFLRFCDGLRSLVGA